MAQSDKLFPSLKIETKNKIQKKTPKEEDISFLMLRSSQFNNI